MINRIGQGTIEYLLIIAVIITIALIAVSLVSGMLSAGSGVDETQSKIYWGSQSVAIIDAIVDANGTGIFVFQSNEVNPITLVTATIDGTDKSIQSGAGKALTLGQKHSETIYGLSLCNSTKKAYNISLTYTTVNSITKKIAAANYVVTCIPLISSSGSSTTSFDSFSPIAGAFIVYSSGEYVNSGTATRGIILPIDQNTICLSGTGCDANIDWNGTDLIFSSG